ncbi:agmatinase [Aquibaculum arenosum]|uniref:Agmatinase n=1 Tax=Aquibaculum arenosum TaxID=3032591 RepID=A0ABT5YNU6_9PROT|nr:agmatinase [Fodinicurvata sp. CAU 1616]MDF2096554.1 agmatinase [Fodinicurvata sp. CAU 1616]
MAKRQAGDQAFVATENKGAVQEHTFAGALSFLRRRYSKDLSDVDLAVMGVPFDLATTNRPGARFGPQAVRAASAIMAWARPHGLPFDPRDLLSIVDTGDCVFDPFHPATVPDAIEAAARRVLDAGAALLSIGGDHFISYPLLKAHAAKHGPLALLHFDAHSDTWTGEEDDINHGTMFWHAQREGLIDPACSVQVGIRTYNAETHGFTILDAPWVHRHGIDDVIARIRETLGNRKIYLTFDIDGLDPAFAPGTGTPVVGGLSTAQALGILRGLQGLNFVGFDVVEVAPAYDSAQITALAAAQIGFEFLALYATRPGGPQAPA